jgi:hypothetical protein
MGIAGAIVGSAVVGAGASAISAGKGAKAQLTASREANQVTLAQLAQQQKQYEQDRADLAPYRDAGYTALGQLASGTATGGEFNRRFTMDDFEADPGFAFRMAEGTKALENSGSARGGVLSGAAQKALARYSQDYASSEYGKAYDRFNNDTTTRYNRLASIAGVGQTAVNTGISAGQANQSAQAAGTQAIANNALNAGNARASQYVATGNAIGGAVGNIGQYFALKDLYGGSGGGGYQLGYSGIY